MGREFIDGAWFALVKCKLFLIALGSNVWVSSRSLRVVLEESYPDILDLNMH